MLNVEEAFQFALRQHQAGDSGRAAEIYQRILQDYPNHAGAMHLLGVVHQERGDLQQAAACIGRAIALDGTKAVYHNNFGVVLRAQGKLAEAEEAYRKAVAIRPQYADALSNLAVVLHEQGRCDEALRSFGEALALQPAHADALYNLGNLYRDLGRTSEAIAVYDKAIAARPHHADAHNNLGIAYLAERRFAEAIAACQKALELASENAEFHVNLGVAYAEQERLEEAARCYDKACRLRPTKKLWTMRSASLCPVVFENADQIKRYRDDLERRLDDFLQTPLESDWRQIAIDGFMPSFHLAHHGLCNRRLKEKFAAIFDRHFPQERSRPGRGRPRIGFLVTRQHEGGFLRGTSGIIEQLDRDKFEPVVLCSRSTLDACRREIRRPDVTWVPLTDRFSDAVERITAARCDILYHWQIGTDPLNYFLPFARLAPVQCTGFGTHGTTGIAAVNYFLSSDLIEPKNGDEHYTEKLYRFRTIPTYQRRIPLPPLASRSMFGLPEKGHLYFCPQRLSKFHPGFDPLLRGILEGDAQGYLILLEGRHKHVAAQLQARFARTLGNAANRVLFAPPKTADYYRWLSLADVLLDPPHYSSSLTGYDAFSLGLPVVTLPGELMVQRYALGLYRKMGLEDLVTRSPEEYVAMAIRLAADRDYRESLCGQIRERSEVLFEDAEAVREHEAFFESALSWTRSAED
jgi:predicted O-linked N-acetylglucosamine transferase (SPINDLY family)